MSVGTAFGGKKLESGYFYSPRLRLYIPQGYEVRDESIEPTAKTKVQGYSGENEWRRWSWLVDLFTLSDLLRWQCTRPSPVRELRSHGSARLYSAHHGYSGGIGLLPGNWRVRISSRAVMALAGARHSPECCKINLGARHVQVQEHQPQG